jgi:hypothetical protein
VKIRNHPSDPPKADGVGSGGVRRSECGLRETSTYLFKSHLSCEHLKKQKNELCKRVAKSSPQAQTIVTTQKTRAIPYEQLSVKSLGFSLDNPFKQVRPSSSRTGILRPIFLVRPVMERGCSHENLHAVIPGGFAFGIRRNQGRLAGSLHC